MLIKGILNIKTVCLNYTFTSTYEFIPASSNSPKVGETSWNADIIIIIYLSGFIAYKTKWLYCSWNLPLEILQRCSISWKLLGEVFNHYIIHAFCTDAIIIGQLPEIDPSRLPQQLKLQQLYSPYKLKNQ